MMKCETMDNIYDFNVAKTQEGSVKNVVADLYGRLVKTSLELDKSVRDLSYQGMSGTRLRNLLMGSALMDLAAYYLNGLVELDDDTQNSTKLDAGEVQQLAREMLASFMHQDIDRRRDQYRGFVKLLRESALIRRVQRKARDA